jgi:hypothetical protein
VANDSTEPIRFDQAYALLQTHNAWRQVSLDSRPTLEPGASARILVNIADHVDGPEPSLFLALRLRAGRRKLDFLTLVPFQPGAETVRHAPRRLPMLRATWPRTLIFWAAVTAATWWQVSWVALIVPVLFVLIQYTNLRHHLPAPLYRARHLIDAAVFAGVFFLLWKTPAVYLAIPTLVAIFVYVVLRSVHLNPQARFVTAASVGAGWFSYSALARSRCHLAE